LTNSALKPAKTAGADRVVDAMSRIIADYSPDVAFRLGPDLNTDALAVDFDLGRLMQAGRTRWRCCELADLSAPIHRLVMEASSHESYAQIRYDLAVAAQRLAVDGRLVLLVRGRKLAPRLGKLAEEWFGEVDFQLDKVSQIRCARPRRGFPEPPYGPSITCMDPISRRSYALASWPGLFAGEALDLGTALLLENIPPVEGRDVLDVGCGYGPISTVAAGRGGRITYADADARALRLTTENLVIAGLGGSALRTFDLSGLLPRSFDVVLSNPPTHAGSETLKTLFERMVYACRPSGDVRIVLRQHLNYEKWLHCLAKVETIALRDGYKVLRVSAAD
jgi:16S rRNA (guanine1207-N2)-methyltransferase